MPWRGLTREQIAREALALIDEQGLSSLTMRAVAARMGVGVMSLYHHVPNRSALIADVVEAVLAEIETPPPHDGDWREPIRAMLSSARQTLLRHPAALPLLVARQPTAGTAALGRMNALIGILMRAGFDAATAAWIHRCVASYLLGYVSLELSSFHPDADGDFEAGLQALLTGLARDPKTVTID